MRLNVRHCVLLGVALGALDARAQFGFGSGVMPVVFFPPNPPAYGDVIDEDGGRARYYAERRLVPPGGMSDLVGEVFYPALSTWLFVPKLPGNVEARLRAYRAQRQSLLHALLDRLVTLHDASPERRAQELREFAAEQRTALATLEADAEQLRVQLIESQPNRVDWHTGRRWRLSALGTRQDWAAKEAEFQLVRAAAFYQSGLLVQQRALLREVAIELQPMARKAQGYPIPRTDGEVMFFSPELSRFRLPPNASPELRNRIGIFNSEKATLKRELHQAVIETDGIDAVKRAEVFARLADTQWPRLVALEDLADRVRDELGLPIEAAAPPPPPWLPAGLLTAIKSYNEDRDTYYGEMQYQMDQAAFRLPRPDMNVSSDERVHRHAAYVAERAKVRREAALKFQGANETRFKALETRYKAIREMLTVVAEKQIDRTTGRPLNADELLRQHTAAMREFDVFGRELTIYTNYRIAMLQPGLSPEQRRLLFNYAVVGLAQPLPNGEVMPQPKATQPYPSF